MSNHPISEPLIHQFSNAESDAERAGLLLATPHAVLDGYQHHYRRALDALGMDAGTAYLDAVIALGSTKRDRFGRAPAFLEEQMTAARVMLCVLAEVIAVQEPPATRRPRGA